MLCSSTCIDKISKYSCICYNSTTTASANDLLLSDLKSRRENFIVSHTKTVTLRRRPLATRHDADKQEGRQLGGMPLLCNSIYYMVQMTVRVLCVYACANVMTRS